ncbi:hypothetical protein CHUAL_009962 [Chamberlinius hualienensis]
MPLGNMTSVKFYLLLVTLAIIFCGSNQSTCTNCEGIYNCPLEPYECQYGIVSNNCTCCEMCAKGPGEECGGNLDQYGTCGERLACQSNLPDVAGTCQYTI